MRQSMLTMFTQITMWLQKIQREAKYQKTTNTIKLVCMKSQSVTTAVMWKNNPTAISSHLKKVHFGRARLFPLNWKWK